MGSPVVFTQERPGLCGKIFKIKKFRTMTDERDSGGKLLPDEQRLTRFGKWLRETSGDELLEIASIVKGDMSIVGPRPLLVEYLDRYAEVQRHRHGVFSEDSLFGICNEGGKRKWLRDLRLVMEEQ